MNSMHLGWIAYVILFIVAYRASMNRSRVAKRWLAIGFLANGAMFFAGYCSGIAYCRPIATSLRPEWVLFAGLAFLLSGAVLMHFDDRRSSGYGVIDLWHFKSRGGESGTYHYRAPDTKRQYTFISSTLTRESVQVAVTLGLMAMILTTYREWTAFAGVFSDPQLLLRHLVVGALGLSVITTLASILCYDYAIRFTWADPVASMFVHKAHRLGRIGFYSLMMSLAGISGFVSWQLGVLGIGLIYFVMWYYYFFPKLLLDEKLKRPGAPPRRAQQRKLETQRTGAPEEVAGRSGGADGRESTRSDQPARREVE